MNFFRKIQIIILFSSFLIFSYTTAQENAGVVDGIWFSKQQITLGENIKINIVLQNQSEKQISGDARFFDNKNLLTSKKFILNPGSIIPLSVDYKPQSIGLKNISVQITTNPPVAFENLTPKTFFVLAPQKKITDTNSSKNSSSTMQIVKNNLVSVFSNSGSSTNKIASTTKDIALNSKKVAVKIYNTIDPVAQNIASVIEKKRTDLSKSIEKEKSNATSTTSMKIKSKQLATVGLSVAGFVFNHWLWHIALVVGFAILRLLYRGKKGPKLRYE